MFLCVYVHVCVWEAAASSAQRLLLVCGTRVTLGITCQTSRHLVTFLLHNLFSLPTHVILWVVVCSHASMCAGSWYSSAFLTLGCGY